MTEAAGIAQTILSELGANHAPGKRLRYVAVPGRAETRWLLPAGEAQIGQVLASWTPYRIGSRLVWAAARTATRIGCVDALPGVIEIEVTGASRAQWESMGWRWSGTPLAVIYVGTPGPRRKAVVHLVERESARCRAVVKVPLAEEAKAAILHEGDVLRTLEVERYERAPKLLHVDRERAITTQTFVEGRPGSRRLGTEHWRLLRSLLLPAQTTSLAAHAKEWAQEAGSAAGETAVLTDHSPLPACWVHGDFTPWNIRRLADGECALLDWELARCKGLPLMDAFHFLHMQDFLFGERPRSYWASLCDDAMDLGIVPGMVRNLEIAYLVQASVECAVGRNEARLRFVLVTLQHFARRAA